MFGKRSFWWKVAEFIFLCLNLYMVALILACQVLFMFTLRSTPKWTCLVALLAGFAVTKLFRLLLFRIKSYYKVGDVISLCGERLLVQYLGLSHTVAIDEKQNRVIYPHIPGSQYLVGNEVGVNVMAKPFSVYRKIQGSIEEVFYMLAMPGYALTVLSDPSKHTINDFIVDIESFIFGALFESLIMPCLIILYRFLSQGRRGPFNFYLDNNQEHIFTTDMNFFTILTFHKDDGHLLWNSVIPLYYRNLAVFPRKLQPRKEVV